MSSIGAAKAKKIEYTLRKANEVRLQECTYISCHGIYSWSHRGIHFLSYQIMVAYNYCDSSGRTPFIDAVNIFNWHKKIIVNSCFIIKVIAEYITAFIALDIFIRGFDRPRDGY